MARFCAHCGTEVSEGNGLCIKCGAPVGDEPGSESDAIGSPGPPVQAAATTPPAASQPAARRVSTTPISPSAPKHSPLFKVAVIALGVIAVITMAGIGGCIYVGNRVRHKITHYAKGLKSGPNPTISQRTPHYLTRPVKSCSSSDRAGFDDYVAAAAAASVPLKPGLTLTSAWADPKKRTKDIEVLTTVQGVQGSTIRISAMRLSGDPYPGSRVLCIADMLNGREFETAFGKPIPDEIPGSTMFTFSKAVFQELKAGHAAALTFYDAYKNEGNTIRLQGLKHSTLTRIEPGDVAYPIIENGEHKTLPVIHAGGDLYEAWVLDDEANPLVLRIVNTRTNWQLSFLKITFPVEKRIEQNLTQNGRVDIYGIYFDFESATLRPESGPVLKEIAEALQDNPGWKIKIDGHTDNIGGREYNLQLSQRRAGAVKQALSEEYGIVADRMTPEGFGASRPKASNDTVEGRALNRRVELVRE